MHADSFFGLMGNLFHSLSVSRNKAAEFHKGTMGTWFSGNLEAIHVADSQILLHFQAWRGQFWLLPAMFIR